MTPERRQGFASDIWRLSHFQNWRVPVNDLLTAFAAEVRKETIAQEHAEGRGKWQGIPIAEVIRNLQP